MPTQHLTPTAMGRWSVLPRQLPPVDQIKELHVYDFDNTLFRTPMPNPKLWHGSTIRLLSRDDYFANGGWWQDSRILAATGEGVEKEEPRAWKDWWNELVVGLVQLSIEQPDALCVLLTGRNETRFGELVKRIAASRKLDFDMVSLKPVVGPNGERFISTMLFKQMFLSRLMETYKNADEIRIYEDRPKHVKSFRDFMVEYNRKQHGPQATRNPITAEVIQVADLNKSLDPEVEVAEVFKMVTDHNKMIDDSSNGFRGERLQVKKTVLFTGYLIDAADTKRLLNLVKVPSNIPSTGLKYHANNVLICLCPAPPPILEEVGGMNAKMKWKVTGVASHDKMIWAACLKPVPEGARFYTDNSSPLVVLALRKGGKHIDANKIKNWQPLPPDEAFVFETRVGEKVSLRIDSEHPGEDAYESLLPNKSTSKRKQEGSPSGRPADRANLRGGFIGPRGAHNGGNFGGRGGRGGGGNNNNNFRGGGGGGGFRGGVKGNRGGQRAGPRGGGRGRGARHYQSLDDIGTRDFSGGATSSMYDDAPSNNGQWGTGAGAGAGASFVSSRSGQGGGGGGGGGGGNNNNAGGSGGPGGGGMEKYY